LNYFTTGQDSNTFAIALANFNNDYNVDIVVTNVGSDTIGVFLGYGNGTFTAQTTYSTGPGSNPYYVIVDDFNNDNISDIAVSNDGSDGIVIFYGYDNGEFKLARTYSLESGSKPYGITAADFNNNTKLEIVVSLWGIGGVAILTEYYAAEFANQTTYLTGSAPQPFSVAVGDFNRDNRSDIVVANSGTDNVGVLLNLGNGTFGMEMLYPIGTDFHPQYVITCDINKDNQSDIVTANSKMNCISVIMGYGNGTFAEQMIYSTGDGSYPFAIASGDFNSDNWLDFVIANEGTDDISIFLGFDYASFQNQQIYSSINNSGPYGIVVSDFNNDKFLDIAVAFYASNTLGILLGYGNGSFATMMIYSTNNGSQPTDVAVGDVNNDSQLDIIVTNYGTNNIGVLLGYGNGSFAPIMSSSTEQDSNPKALIVADLNNDTQLDIVVANYGTNSIAVLLGYGNGTFSIIGIYLTGNKSSPHALAVGDFNHDDQLDIVVANYGTDSVGVLLGYGNGTFGNQKLFSSGDHSNPCWVSVGDFNRDNQLDIATANWNNNNVGILLGYGNGTFADIKTYSTGTGSAPYSIGVDDFNNDSILDIAVANQGSGDIVVLFGFGDGSFLLGTSYSTGSGSQPWVLGIGDFNNDSRLDMTVANFQSNNIGIFLGSGNQPLGGMTTYDTGDGSQPHSVAIGDFNNDGRLDIAVANYGTDNIGIFLGHGNGIFDIVKKNRIRTGSAPYSIAVDDFNNDHHLDIVVADSGTDTITILFGYGNGTFAIGRIYSTGAQSCPYTVTIGDFNNDNISDIAVANSGTSNIFLLYGYGNGTFGNETSYSLGYNYQPYAVAVHDLTQDNWMNIVIACYGTDHVETLIKMC
jgi:streptogramin lyase